MRRFLTILAAVATLGACVDNPRAPERQTVKRSTAAITPRPETRQCLATLGSKQVGFSPIPDQYFGAGCSTIGTVQLASLQSDDASLGLANIGPVACPLASTFANWARYGVDRAARQILGSPLVKIETMGSYSCRNVAGSGRRSAHATADAIDISGFVLADGRRITVLSGWLSGSEEERQFLRVIHTSACKRFGTVLGPNYNAAHRDHLHVELGGGSYCR
jgi:hypothetical protein